MYYKGPSPSIDKSFYDTVREAASTFRLVEQIEIPPISGKAVAVSAGHCARLICHQGPQIADVCIFNSENPEEHLWANQTLNREGACVSVYSRLWSNLPMFRPLMTIIEDTIVNQPSEAAARHHSILGAHCNPRFWQSALGTEDHPFARDKNCYYNLVAAVEKVGLPSKLVHDNLNLFQKIGILPATGGLVMEPSDARTGDHVDFFSELDVLMAIALCPQGSGKNPPSSPEQDTRAIRVEVYDTGFAPLPTDYAPV